MNQYVDALNCLYGLKKEKDIEENGGNEVLEKEELTDGQELFIALLEGDDKKIEEKLETYVFGIEYLFATNGGEPDLKDVLALKLLERIKGEKYYPSMIYQDFYLEHIGIKYKGKEKEG